MRNPNEEMPFIKRVSIDGLFGHKNINWELNDVNVLVGANGTGKSTILKMIHLALTVESANDDPRHFQHVFENANRIQIDFENDYNFLFSKIGDDDKNTFKYSEILSQFESLSAFFNGNESTLGMDTDELKTKRKHLNKIIESLKMNISDSSGCKIRTSRCNYITNQVDYEKPKNNLLERIGVVYLSTFDMMLLSKKEYDEIQGEIYTQLDLEIDREVRKFTKHQLELNNKISDDYILNKRKKDFSKIKEQAFRQVHVFQSALNELFNPHEKHFQISSDGDVNVMFFGEEISLSCLSSGEKQLLLILLKVVNSSERPAILLLDEPEISLHLDWQEKLIRIIKEINNNCQIIIVTHSPAVVMNGWLDRYVDMKDLVVC